MEAVKETVTALPNKLFLSGSDIQTPVGDGGHTPSSRPPLNGSTSSSVGTFAVKAGLAQMLKIPPPSDLKANSTEVLLWMSSSSLPLLRYLCGINRLIVVRNKRELRRRPALVRSWLLNGFLLISVNKAVSRECPTRK